MRLPDEHRHSLYWTSVFLQPCMCSQPLGLSWSLVFDHPVALVSQLIFWKWTKFERAPQTFLRHVGSKCSICWKHSRNDFGNMRSSTCIAKVVGDFNYGPRETAPPDPALVDWLGAHIQGVAAGAIESQAIPAAWREDTESFWRSIRNEHLGCFCGYRYRCFRTLRCFP